MEAFMEKTTLSEKGQIVIPKAVRVAHGWEPGMEIMVEDLGDGVLLKLLRPYRATVIEDVLGCVGYKGPRKSLKDMRSAIAVGAGERV
jgi:AbrB family looped-hinge helix DNA binding protein